MTLPLALAIDALLPQTQCRKCGFDGCLPYAEAMAADGAPINRCPPGGARGVARLAAALARPPLPLDRACGTEQPLHRARIDEARCIGCTLCIQACPVDAIVGAVKRMHTVVAALCTGCDLCVAPCPMDCIEMVEVQPARAWTDADAAAARLRMHARTTRLAREREASEARLAAKALRKLDELDARDDLSIAEIARRKEVVHAAIERARPARGAVKRDRRTMTPAKRQALFETLRSANPEPKSELEFGSPFELLVAVLLSAQATDRSVNLATQRLFPAAGTPQAIAALGEAGLIPYIQTIGLYRTKARHLVQLCRLLIERHQGQVPRDRDALEALPGVGRKTANVVLNVAFGEPTIAVDTHIFRVANRTGLAPGDTVEEVEQKLLKCVPEEFRHHAHHWLILHGRYVCKARNPECWRCAIAPQCAFRPKTSAPG